MRQMGDSKDWSKMNNRQKAAVLNFYSIPHDLKSRAPSRPRTAADGPSEHQLQATVIGWWRLAHKAYSLPEYLLFAIPNGGARDSITGARLKAEGVRRGVPDLMLAVPTRDAHGLFVEMKLQESFNKASASSKEAQATFSHSLTSRGYAYKLCFDSTEAISAIKAYLD